MALFWASILEISGCVKRNSKVVFLLFFFFMWLIFWGNQTSSDRLNYTYTYEKITMVSPTINMEFGFQFIMICSKKLGLSSTQFFAICAFVGYYLISKTIFKYSDTPAFVACLYFFYPFLLDAEQIRSFIGMAIIIYAFPYLDRKKEFDTLKYTVLCGVAMLFQYSCIVFFSFLLIKFDKKTICKGVAVCIIGLGFLRYYSDSFIRFIPSFVYAKLINNFDSFDMKNVISVIFFILVFGITIYLCGNLEKKSKDKSRFNFYRIISKVNMISFSFLPLVLMSDNFTRLPRTIFVLNYIVFGNEIGKKIKTLKAFIIFLFSFTVIGSRFAIYFWSSGMDKFIIPFFYEGVFKK